MRWPILCLISLGACFLAGIAHACLWDNDTLEMERHAFPDTLELVTGKFVRHSPAYYRWRVDDRLRRLEQGESSPDLFDDVAVAYDKLGQQEKAIETILKKEELFPGEYETYANLGTFYIHAGEFEKGLEQIERAIEINPDAHFGREVYQKLLVEYVLTKRQDGEIVLPLDTDDIRGYSQTGFAKYLREKGHFETSSRNREDELDKAIQGVLGMMRFGHYDSPILLEALGDLLLSRGSDENAGLLAARAYLKASYEVEDESAQAAYRAMAEQSLAMREDLTLTTLEATFANELAEADAWYAEVRTNEEAWIAAGKNVDEEFAAVYYVAPRINESTRSPKQVGTWLADWWRVLLRLFIASGLVGIVGFLGWRMMTRRNRTRKSVKA